jgi:heptosyltransferase III
LRILLIQLKQIGDVLITTSLLKNIKENFPESKVDILIYDYCEGVVINNPYVDNIITISKEERKNSFYFYKKIYRLRKEKYDYSIDVLMDVRSALITYIVNANKKIVAKANKLRNKIFYNTRIETETEEVVKRRNLLLKGIKKDIILHNKVKIYLKEEEIKRLKDRMITNGVDFEKPIAAFGINSRRAHKIWKMDYFVEVIDFLIKKYDFQIILYNNKEEREYSLKAKENIKQKINVFTDIYTKDIRELAALLKNCDIFIGNEGGPRHVAESVGINTFSIGYITHIRKNWILNEEKWEKENRMVNLNDYLNISEEEFETYRKKIRKDRDKEKKEFQNLPPNFVIEKIVNMIDELVLEKKFREEIKWKKL